MLRAAIVFGLLAVAPPVFAVEAAPSSADPITTAQPAGTLGKVAEQHFQTGLAFYRAGDYASARIEFQAAYDLSRLPDLLHNLSRTAQLQGKLADSIAFEERYLSESGDALSEHDADAARGRIARLRDELLRQSRAPVAPPREPEAVPKRPMPTPARTDADRAHPPVGAWALVAGGGALTIAGIGCGGAALALQARLESGAPISAADASAGLERGVALDRAGIALSVIGGAALVGGTIWALVHRYRGRRGADPVRAPAGSALSLAW